ncbi:ABC transporter [Streptomyces sp. CB03234]|uniref:ABC transporter permease subunit n=1 Tax=Streptomyces sp. (strain CB03234) TaxID=1703937 RepID=UPI00093E7F94|nr:ABC transporter permease subunit [Streptomyces sp. CB03234]OKK06564.1 ABC transporter [Streptomyces sp. CB03234]
MTTAPYQQQQYTSPIPVRRAHLGDALASEWTKIRSVRSTMWTLGVMVVLMLGVGLLAAVAVSASGTDMGGESVLVLGFYGVLLGSLCVVTLGVLTIASEYGTGMIRTTLTACPSRSRVLLAKAVVFFLLTFTVTTVTAALVAAIHSGMVGSGTATGEQWLRATVGAGLFVAVLGLLSLSVGALIRHSAGAITVMIGVMLLPLVAGMFMFSESLADVREVLLEYAIPSLLIAFYSEQGLSQGGPHGWTPLWILLGVTAVAMTGAFFAMDRRDVK